MCGHRRFADNYDNLCRTRTLPAADTTTGTGNLTATCNADDTFATLTQNGITRAWTLDSAERGSWTDSTAGTTSTAKIQPRRTKRPGGSISLLGIA